MRYIKNLITYLYKSASLKSFKIPLINQWFKTVACESCIKSLSTKCIKSKRRVINSLCLTQYIFVGVVKKY